jgi:hypothetical protein
MVAYVTAFVDDWSRFIGSASRSYRNFQLDR